MRRLGQAVLSIGAAAVTVLLGGTVPAGAASGVTYRFAGTGVVEYQNSLQGPSFMLWDVDAVAVGSNLTAGTLALAYCFGENCGFPHVNYTFSGGGATFSGEAATYDNAAATGEITSATGRFAGLDGDAVTITFTISPEDTSLLPPISLSTSSGEDLGPSLAIGSLAIS